MQVRKQLADWWSTTSGAAEGVQQRYANGEADLDTLSEAARDVIRDKEVGACARSVSPIMCLVGLHV